MGTIVFSRCLLVGVLGAASAVLSAPPPAGASDTLSRLVSYGHSWPAGLGVERPYPARVADRRDLSISNRAYPGDLSADTLARVRLRPPRRSDIVTVQTGINDANAYGLAGLERYKKNVRAILTVTKQARLVVLVLDQRALRPSDYPPYNHGTAEVLRTYRMAARELAAAVGATVVAPVLDEMVEWQVDGMHPSGPGHKVIAEAGAGAIRQSAAG